MFGNLRTRYGSPLGSTVLDSPEVALNSAQRSSLKQACHFICSSRSTWTVYYLDFIPSLGVDQKTIHPHIKPKMAKPSWRFKHMRADSLLVEMLLEPNTDDVLCLDVYKQWVRHLFSTHFSPPTVWKHFLCGLWVFRSFLRCFRSRRFLAGVRCNFPVRTSISCPTILLHWSQNYNM